MLPLCNLWDVRDIISRYVCAVKNRRSHTIVGPLGCQSIPNRRNIKYATPETLNKFFMSAFLFSVNYYIRRAFLDNWLAINDYLYSEVESSYAVNIVRSKTQLASGEFTAEPNSLQLDMLRWRCVPSLRCIASRVRGSVTCLAVHIWIHWESVSERHAITDALVKRGLVVPVGTTETIPPHLTQVAGHSHHVSPSANTQQRVKGVCLTQCRTLLLLPGNTHYAPWTSALNWFPETPQSR